MTAPTLNKASEKIASRETLRLCTAGSVDDGKSTFVGRLLHDTKSVLADQLASVERTSADRGFEGLDLSLLVDGLRAEREQGITIDVAYRYFATDKRTFILADTPGHVQYTRNTVTGVSTSQVVVLLVDARHGVVEQTRRHLSVSALLGVRTVILAVNKIDLVDYSEEVFRNIEKEFVGLASALDVTDTHVVPISALKGDNVAEASTHMAWYTGPTVLEILENVEVSRGRAHDLGFRFPIQYVIREHATDYRGYAGTINAGSVSVGDTVYLPEGRTTQVTHIDSADGSLQTASVGEAVVLRLAQEIDLIRGELIAGEDRPESVRSFNATVVGLADRTIKPGAAVKVRYGTELVRGRVAAIERVLDIDGVNDNEAPETYGLNDIAHVRIDVAGELEVEDYAARGAIGSFLLIDQSSGDTLAAGLVGHRLRNNWSI
ncbi:Sulfate adenyltransferase subunit 1 [Corynebacterium glutamicum MT]|uniref:sulfate adenylyltransferase n=2 Tax=Corynebacterium glutamicum TaxID=1718 RepID=A0AB36IHW8_CORGT|nr:GTP-binding protein [Corynebacterium glutamicum]AGN20321.1 Sulfate adenyltransferase subunit 1 [Corynebacterium glutamicum SCgG1]AGN23345.1 Sulfate adenyltransferase subunit 1 [Corynebacterium glutamicum SCgG2]EGV41799.1 sulfate adenylyltransferase subunit 1 [Corynebacterium glutamicum S9114]EOA64638.1 Sulfate adenyltransferase subunit 1 [Corynebacterium glutamicum MT]EPP39750.1 Sulfate adenyltransferase subunit 1 [Corynebacterium glutamicum Z188]